MDKLMQGDIEQEYERDRGITTESRGVVIHSMVIAGQIEGHFAAAPQCKSTKYEECIPALVAVEENDKIDGLLLLINTVGGDIEAGLGIAELIASACRLPYLRKGRLSCRARR